MTDKIDALQADHTWTVTTPPHKTSISCR